MMSPRRLVLLLVLVALLLGALAWPYTVDDAFVIGRYAARLASGRGYTFVDGVEGVDGPATDGVTGPPALLLGVLASLLGIDPVDAAKAVGLLAGALAVGVLVYAAQQRVVGRLAAPVAGLFLVLAPSYLVWSVAGLETGIAALASIVLAASVLSSPQPVRAGFAAAVLVSFRPECIPLAAALLSYLFRRRNPNAMKWAAILPALAWATIIVFRLSMFGTVGPLSLAAKPPDLVHGAVYALRVLTYGTAFVAIPPALYAARGSRRMRVLGVSILVHLLAITLSGGDWMPGVRLFVPALPLLAWMVGVGISDLARLRPSPLTLGSAIFVVLAVPLALFVFETERAREAGATREREGRALARYLDERAHRVALIDVGFLSYVGHFSPVDLAGITDPSIGRLVGDHLDKPVTGAMLIDRGVDAIVLHSATEPRFDGGGHLTELAGHPIERRLAMDENVRSAFTVAEVMPYADDYWYVVLLRRDAPGAPSSMPSGAEGAGP